MGLSDFETPWLVQFGCSEGECCWHLDKAAMRERALFYLSLWDIQVCPFFPFPGEEDLDRYLKRLPTLIEVGPDSPYKIEMGVLCLRFDPKLTQEQEKERRKIMEDFFWEDWDEGMEE